MHHFSAPIVAAIAGTLRLQVSMAVRITFDVASLKVIAVDSDDAFGWSKTELFALDAFALFPRWWNAGKTAEVPVMTFLRPKTGPLVPVTIAFERSDPFLRATITERTALSEAERELEATNAYLHAIVENIPDMIFVKDAKTHEFKRFNRAGEELLGFTRGELLGKTDHDFYPKEQADFFHQKDDETMQAGVVVDIPQEPILTKFKGERILHTRKIPVYDTDGNPQYLLGISEDITERIKAEQMARELADIVRFARDAVVSFSADGTIVAWNPSAERLYGVPAERAIGMSFLRFVPDDERARFEKQLRTLEEASVSEVVRLRADGAEIQVEESMFPVQGRIATMARDLTELSRWREAARRLGVRAVSSPAMDAVLQEADLVAQNADATVLLLGETGVGKSHVARRIHQKSARTDHPFFEVNCAGLGRELVESELFGHERGAFTGAVSQKRGLVETAEGGTLFLDEVGELPIPVQAQLLTFLDSHTFRRVGGTRTMRANVRLLAATNVDLKAAVAEGRFRSDLFYRLSVVPLTIPPLRERRSEIAALAGSLLSELARRLGKHVTIDRKAEEALERYRWPGNIRELRNALERALILSRGERITIEHLPADIRSPQAPIADSGRSLDTREREHILEVLKETGGNRTKAAELLGISRSTLKRKLAEMRRE
jgi:two-component system response regulator HydG